MLSPAISRAARCWYVRAVSEWTDQARALIEELAVAELEPQLHERLAATLRGLTEEAEMGKLMLEAREEELEATRQLLAGTSYPIIEVRSETLCVPIVGPVDAQIMEGVTEAVMREASQRQARWVVLDLTGAQVGDIVAADALGRLFRTLRLIGVRGMVSGMSTSLARTLARMDDTPDVPVHRSLAGALALVERRSAEP